MEMEEQHLYLFSCKFWYIGGSTFKIEATEVIGITTTSITLNQIQSYIAPTGENELP